MAIYSGSMISKKVRKKQVNKKDRCRSSDPFTLNYNKFAMEKNVMTITEITVKIACVTCLFFAFGNKCTNTKKCNKKQDDGKNHLLALL